MKSAIPEVNISNTGIWAPAFSSRSRWRRPSWDAPGVAEKTIATRRGLKRSSTAPTVLST